MQYSIGVTLDFYYARSSSPHKTYNNTETLTKDFSGFLHCLEKATVGILKERLTYHNRQSQKHFKEEK